jgi:hypothetical protein
MRSLPSGTVTLAFTNIESSSKLMWEYLEAKPAS